jgi:hypothetical protein
MYSRSKDIVWGLLNATLDPGPQTL